MKKEIDLLDKIAGSLEKIGLIKEARYIDAVANSLEKLSGELSNTNRRPEAILPHDHPKVIDNKDHFPIPDANHARNALARVNQYSAAPAWYDGSLEDLKKFIADKVKSKFHSIDVTEESYKN